MYRLCNTRLIVVWVSQRIKRNSVRHLSQPQTQPQPQPEPQPKLQPADSAIEAASPMELDPEQLNQARAPQLHEPKQETPGNGALNTSWEEAKPVQAKQEVNLSVMIWMQPHRFGAWITGSRAIRTIWAYSVIVQSGQR